MTGAIVLTARHAAPPAVTAAIMHTAVHVAVPYEVERRIEWPV